MKKTKIQEEISKLKERIADLEKELAKKPKRYTWEDLQNFEVTGIEKFNEAWEAGIEAYGGNTPEIWHYVLTFKSPRIIEIDFHNEGSLKNRDFVDAFIRSIKGKDEIQ